MKWIKMTKKEATNKHVYTAIVVIVVAQIMIQLLLSWRQSAKFEYFMDAQIFINRQQDDVNKDQIKTNAEIEKDVEALSNFKEKVEKRIGMNGNPEFATIRTRGVNKDTGKLSYAPSKYVILNREIVNNILEYNLKNDRWRN